ncbi:MAG: aspartate carbamoyltransferase [Clostridia bacterium]|nr:aspartate carbamoyltransferase [Clostridia bacterium]
MEHILSCKQFSRKSLEELLDLAKDIKLNPKKYENALENKIIAPIFFEPSTRTRLSFETAALKLGAKNITTENAQNSSTKKGETLQDTISVLSGYADCIVMRHSQDDAAEIAASVSKVPILNAGSGKKDHPSQSLLDIFTIREKRGTIDGIKIAILGDLVHGRTIHSLLEILTLYKNIEVFGLSKACFRLPEKYKELLLNNNIKYTECASFNELPKDIDVLYHTRIQQERFEGDLGKEEFIINKSVLSEFSSKTLVMHPLPRLNEISEDIDDDPRAIYFEQAHNGVPIRMAMYLTVLNKNK